MPEIPMQAKFPGTCVVCFESIGKGDAIFYLTDTKKAKHRACVEQKKPKAPAKKAAKKTTKSNSLRAVKEKVEPKVDEGKAAPKPTFRRFTVVEILRLLPALRAFDELTREAGFDLQEMDDSKLAEIFRVAKNANFKEDAPY